MTVLGKVLVFVNLAFSVAVAALIMMAYVARTNWANAYKDVEQRYKVEVSRVSTLEDELKRAEAEGEANVKAVKSTLEDTQRQLKQAQDVNKGLQEQLARRDDEIKKSSSGTQGVQSEVEKLSKQAQTLTAHVADLNKRLDDQAKEVSTMRDRAVRAEIENASLKDRNDELARALEEREKALVKLKASPGGATMPTALNPPPGNVEGLVKNFDPSSGLLTITIGSDSGITKGHTLEVYRLSPNGRYVGTMRIMDVRPNEAVGKMVSKPLAPVQVGDKVASKIS
jgi:hypothetical protein